jgi:hypothetical protein
VPAQKLLLTRIKRLLASAGQVRQARCRSAQGRFLRLVVARDLRARTGLCDDQELARIDEVSFFGRIKLADA